MDTQVSTEQASTQRTDLLRLIPPIAALGTSGVLQVIAVTDLLGGSLSKQMHSWGYLLGALFGIAVACSAEGGAAYLMDLYDKHLLAGDSTWVLRLAMAGYVCACGAALHWWADNRGIPVVLSWLLAGMSASSLFLWSRGARWQNREQMRSKGQLDTALPRMAMSAKLLHPIRWAITMYLISWDQVSTTEQARETYAAWKAHRTSTLPGEQRAAITVAATVGEQVSSEQSPISAPGRRAISAPPAVSSEHHPSRHDTEQLLTEQHDDLSTEQDPDEQVSVRRTISRTVSVTEQVSRSKASIEQLTEALANAFGDEIPGRPRALKVLREQFGSCSEPRAKAAIELLAEQRGNAQIEAGQPIHLTDVLADERAVNE